MRYVFFAILLFLFSGLQAQLTNTAWRGEFLVPAPLACSLAFSGDSILVANIETGEILEIMRYKAKGDTVFISKIGGLSSCNLDTESVYLFRRDEKKLFVTALNDACEERRMAFPPALDLLEL